MPLGSARPTLPRVRSSLLNAVITALLVGCNSGSVASTGQSVAGSSTHADSSTGDASSEAAVCPTDRALAGTLVNRRDCVRRAVRAHVALVTAPLDRRRP